MFLPRVRPAFCVVILLLGSRLSWAQPASPPATSGASAEVLDRVEGNWEVTSTDPRTPGKNEVTKVSLWKGRQLLRNGEPMTPGGSFPSGFFPNNWAWVRLDASDWVNLRSGALTFFADGSFTLKSSGSRVSTLHAASGNVMRGRWRDGEASGEETWRRLVPHITALEFVGVATDRVTPDDRPGRLRVKYEGSDGSRGNKRMFTVNILGDNLGGTHYAWIEGGDIEAYGLLYIRTKPSGETYRQNLDFGGQDPITGRVMEGNVWSRITPGIKRLHFDDITIPFQLEVDGIPAPGPNAQMTIIGLMSADGRFIPNIDKLRRVALTPEPGALENEEVLASSIDPKTGEMTIVRRNPDGSTTTTKGKREIAPDGTETIVELDAKGNRRETVISPDGTTAITRTDELATKITTTFAPDGSIDTLEQEAGGSSSYSHRRPDGSVMTEQRDRTGALVSKTTRHPDGLVERADPDGNLTSTRTDEDGRATAVTVDRDGNVLTVVTNRAGGEEQRERIVNKPIEPGRAYFEDVLKGTDWNALPPSLKHRYADSETQLNQTALRHADEDAFAAKQRAEAAAREAGDANDRAATNEKLAAIRAEQEAADRRAAELHTAEERRRQVENARDKGKLLQRQYYDAIARGDQAEATRILNLQDEHEAATMDVYKFTPAENQEMLRAAGVREALQNKIAERAFAAAIEENATNEAWQKTKDSVTNVSRFVSVGSQMQHETSRTSRSADHERTAARAKLAEIDRLLLDDSTTKEERKMLEEMRDVSSVQEQGASELLAANARITTAGYVIDAAMTVSGGVIAKGLTKFAGGVTGVVAGETASRATVAVLETSARKLVNEGATRATTAVASRIVGEEAATKLGSVLATDVSTPAAQKAAEVARRVVGDKVADATAAFATRTAEVASTNVSDVPRLVREAVTGRTAAAEAGAATAAAREVAATSSAAPARAAEARYTPEELEALHQPGRSLTPEEIQRKADLYLMRNRTHEAAVRDIVDGRPISDIEGPAAEYRNINNAINDARATHGLPPITQPKPPVAGPARSLLPPVAEAKPVGASTVIERSPTATSTARAAAETVVERPPTAVSSAPSRTEVALNRPPPAAAPATRPFTAEELESLHQPGKNLTGAESLRKGQLYEMRANSQRTAVEAAAAGKPAEFEAAADEFRKVNEAINKARAANGLPPIHPPSAPVAAPARSLLLPPEKLPAAGTPVGRDAATAIESVGPNGTQRITPVPATATAREAGVSTIILPADQMGTQRLIPTPPTATARQAGLSTIILPADQMGTQRLVPALTGVGAREAAITRAAEPAAAAAAERIAPRPVVPPEPTILPANRIKAVNSAPLQGNAAMSEAELASFAKDPPVRLKEDLSRLEGFGDMREVIKMKDFDFTAMANGRARWMKVPREAKLKLETDFRAAIDEAAAVGDKWARRLQAEMNEGTFNFRYEPGIGTYGGFATGEASAIINPLKNGQVLTGDELASNVLHEYVHTYRGPRKFAADFNPDFIGVTDKGQYNEGRAFLAESIFNRNLARARQLNGKMFNPQRGQELAAMMGVERLPAGAPSMARGNQAMNNLQDSLVDRFYAHLYADNPKLAAERLAAFRGGSMKNTEAFLNKKIRETLASETTESTPREVVDRLYGQIESELLLQLETEGGRFLPNTK